jgi:uncharacterized protein (TIGR03083 family)
MDRISRVNRTLDFVDHVSRESQRFASALAGASADARVPTCPDWDADDLLWHLAEVQWFWGTIVRERIADAAEVEGLAAERPSGRAGLREFYERVSNDLVQTLADTSPDTVVWTWSDDHTVGFIRRRQAHEALIHRIDAELTAASRTPMDASLSADGVDEVLKVMYGGAPPWGTFTPDDSKTVRLMATDTDDSWFVTLGRFSGSDPDGDRVVDDEPDIRVAASDSGQAAAATISGLAVDLDCELWHRPVVATVERSGDEATLAEFAAAIAPGID